MSYTYHTHGTCSRQITFDLDEEGKVRNVKNSLAAATATCKVSPHW